MKQKLIAVAQSALGLGILGFIIYRLHAKGELEELGAAFQAAAGNWPTLLLGASLFAVCLVFCALRWKLLLHAIGIHIRLGRIFVLYMVGHFFNAFLFGSTGGDVVKAYYVSSETDHKKTEVVATVFIDRILGLLALVGLSVTMLLLRLQFFLSHPQTRIAVFFNAAVLIGTVLGLVIVFRKNVFEHFSLFRRLEEQTAVGRIIGKVYNAFRLCLNHPGLLSRALLLSLANHVTLIVSVYFLGSAIGLKLRFMEYLTIFPTINSVAALPLTPGGIGTREAAAAELLGVFGVSSADAVTVSLLIWASVFAWSLLGGVVYCFFSISRGGKMITSPPEEA